MTCSVPTGTTTSAYVEPASNGGMETFRGSKEVSRDHRPLVSVTCSRDGSFVIYAPLSPFSYLQTIAGRGCPSCIKASTRPRALDHCALLDVHVTYHLHRRGLCRYVLALGSITLLCSNLGLPSANAYKWSMTQQNTAGDSDVSVKSKHRSPWSR